MDMLPKNTLLMIIDVQKAIDDPMWGEQNNPDAELQMRELLNEWRVRKMPILHVKHMSADPNSAYRPNQIGNDFKPLTRPLTTEEVLEKQTNSAFIGTDLQARLDARGITHLVVVGVITNNSVEATVRMAGNLGYKTIVVSDGTYTFGREAINGEWITADTLHTISLTNMNGEYATILSTKSVLKIIQ